MVIFKTSLIPLARVLIVHSFFYLQIPTLSGIRTLRFLLAPFEKWNPQGLFFVVVGNFDKFVLKGQNFVGYFEEKMWTTLFENLSFFSGGREGIFVTTNSISFSVGNENYQALSKILKIFLWACVQIKRVKTTLLHWMKQVQMYQLSIKPLSKSPSWSDESPKMLSWLTFYM